MLSLDQPVTIIADVHGNDDSLEESLRRASGGKRKIDVPALGHVVFTGDLNDKAADQYLKILDRILRLQEQTRVTLCMGNHEAVMLQALQCAGMSHMRSMWMINGGKLVLQEVARRRKKLMDTLPKDDINADFEYAQKLLLEGEYHDRIFSQMCLMEDVVPSVRAVHAGINEYYAYMTPRHANGLLQQFMQRRTLGLLNTKSDIADVVWMKNAHKLSVETSDALKERNISVIVHGHEVLHDQVQSLHVTHGIGVMDGDISLGSRKNWGYIRIDERGKFTAASEHGGIRPFGELTDEGYLSPKPA
jgi:hypothetical protein